MTTSGIVVPVTLLVKKITEGNELQNILACQYAGTENSFSPWQLPGFLIRSNHFPSKETTLQKIREREGNEELDKLCLGEIVQEQKPPPRRKEDSVYWLLEQQNYEDVATGSGVCDTQPP